MSSARTIPIWDSLEVLSLEHFRDVSADIDADIAVVGAGIAGLASALCLVQEGRRVTIIDHAGFGEGESLRTTAHLASALDDRYTHLARWHGARGARLAAISHGAAVDWIEQFCLAQDDRCGFQRVKGYLFSHNRDPTSLREEADAAVAAGLPARMLEAGLSDLPGLGPVLEFDRQARVDMDRLLQALAQTLIDQGVTFLKARVDEVKGGDVVTLATGTGALIHAAKAIMATNVPFNDTVAIHTKQAPYRTYAVAGPCAPGSIPDALFWDDADPYHYVRLVEDRRQPGQWLAIVGGEDHKTGQDADPLAYVRLQAWARDRFPGLDTFTYAWSGQVLEPVDGLGFIGADPGGQRNVYIVTGDSGNGVTNATVAGMLLADLIAGRANPWAELYDPQRKTLRAGGDWLGENANVAGQYGDWLRGGDLDDIEQLARGEGAVVRRGLHRVAVYRDGEGTLHAYSARCPHLGCAVRWSPQEKSWDCPCHGSRFDGQSGAILNGPARESLQPFTLDDTHRR